jgi:predicted  nucleic acid-binding Zn-ribbon protein
MSPPEDPPRPPQRSGPSESIALRLWEATKKLITITDHLKLLEKEDDRIRDQVTELGRAVLDLVKEVRELSGQMKGIEKRFDDKDKMIDALIKMRVSEEVEKVLSKAPRKSQPRTTRKKQ